jgi:hypothetical protein
MFARLLVITLIMLGFGTANASAFPKELNGNSVVVSWVETLERNVPERNVRSRLISYSLSIYISTSGRPFSRLMRAGGPAGYSDVTGRSPSDASSGATVHFDGRQLLSDTLLVSGARRVAVDFDAGYRSCSARVIVGRQGGAKSTTEKGMRGGTIEILRTESSTPTCSIRTGNVFGGG